MEKGIREGTIYYQEGKHHCEQLRATIDPKTLDALEINENPSAITRKVYESMYRKELKNGQHLKNELSASKRNSPNYLPKIKTGKSCSIFANTGAKITYPDYHHDKYERIQSHIEHNYDGGSGFFRASQDYEQNVRGKYFLDMKNTLQNQLQQIRQNKLQLTNLKEREKQTYHKQLISDQYIMQRQRQHSLKAKQNNREEQLRDIQEQRTSKGRRSIFKYNNYGRHHPITNPIQYHIDNPYILRSIQNSRVNQNRLSIQ